MMYVQMSMGECLHGHTRPLHIAVVQSEMMVVDRLVAMMEMLKVKVDHYNKLRQVGGGTAAKNERGSPKVPWC